MGSEDQLYLQAILNKGGKSRLISLPNEEDRRLPLMKLLENLEGVSASLPIPQGSKSVLLCFLTFTIMCTACAK